MIRPAGRVVIAAAVGLFAIFPASARPAPLHACSYEYAGDMRTFTRCAWIDAAGAAHLLPRHLVRQRYDRHGLARLFVNRWYYVRRDGRSAPVMAFDNGPDDFAEGLARSVVGSKVGFIDRRLNLVIPRRYDGAYQFAGGTAQVCIGCRVERAGEHEMLVGGRWGKIDRRGALVAPLRAK